MGPNNQGGLVSQAEHGSMVGRDVQIGLALGLYGAVGVMRGTD